ncbi:MAG TPA: hypothetical protein VGN12_12145 [Pirellulales bacterium]|jgi:hypothetical protein
MSQLSKQLSTLLEEVISKYHPELLDAVDTSPTIALNWTQRDKLRSSCASELCETGLQDDDEPNERGLQLEELIDWLGRDMTT